MEVQRLADFRQYYNTSIHPELMRLERLRRRLLALVFGSIFFLIILSGILLYLNVALYFFLMFIPGGYYLFYLGQQIQGFRQTFKPRVIQLILDFMNESLNTRQLQYTAKRHIPWEIFEESRLFKTPKDYFLGEDYIEGLIGEMPFEMSELQVREISPASNRLQEVFEGVFLYATFPEENEGTLAFWPRHRKKYLTRTIKAYVAAGAENVDHEIMDEQFLDHFVVYATPDTKVASVLTASMQERLADYATSTGKEIFGSFQDQQIYVAVTEEKDLLEPHIFRSNRSFDLIRQFYQDISLITKIVEDFDQTH